MVMVELVGCMEEVVAVEQTHSEVQVVRLDLFASLLAQVSFHPTLRKTPIRLCLLLRAQALGLSLRA
jgi:hypothetical protein